MLGQSPSKVSEKGLACTNRCAPMGYQHLSANASRDLRKVNLKDSVHASC